MQGETQPSTPLPSYDDLVADLRLVREKGIGRLRRLAVPALDRACRVADMTTGQEQEPAAIEALLRRAVEQLGGGRSGEAGSYTFGLVQGTKLWLAAERRKAAAKAQGVSVDRFRKFYEPELIEQVAEGILAVCHERYMRQARVQMERRHPADSRLAVQWVERFEAYNRIWTPVWKLGADLEAAVATYREQPADHLPWDPTSNRPYDPVDQAQMYARYALHAYAWYHLELRKFMTRHGGLWLLSTAEAETQASDAVYRIGWHNDLVQDEDSWLRTHLADARHEEPDHFIHLLLSTSAGSQLHQKWQAYVAACGCPDPQQPQDGCQVHATIAACRDYCELIDAEWLKIADWYHPGSRPARGVMPDELYARQVAAATKRDGDHATS